MGHKGVREMDAESLAVLFKDFPTFIARFAAPDHPLEASRPIDQDSSP